MEDSTYQTFTGTAHVLLAEINLEWNNYEKASRYLEKGFDLLQLGGIGYTLTYYYCIAARIKLALGDTDGAIEALQAAAQATPASELMQFQIRNLVCQANLALLLGNTKTAVQWAAGDLCELPDSLPAHLHENQQISLARVYLAQGDLHKAVKILDQIQPGAESAGRIAHLIDIYILKTLASQACGEFAAAMDCLEKAISLAAPEGYIHKFLEHGESMQFLLQKAAERGITPVYVKNLLSAFEAQDHPVFLGKPEGIGDTMLSTPLLIEPLTARELEVLHLIAEGLTYNEIADQILVSLNTVRTHVKNIYSKLVVHKRSQAIAKAKELDIL
jgi:LuxR family maltose regulon positive regulatory protein